MTAGDSAHTGDDRHQYGKNHDFVQRRFEQSDDCRRNKRGGEIHPEPDSSAPCAGHHRRKHIVLFIQARHTQDVVVGLFLNHIHDVIHHDLAQQPAVLVNDGGRNQVTILKLFGDRCSRGAGKYRFN